MAFGSPLKVLVSTSGTTKPRHSAPEVINLDDTDPLLSSGWLPLLSEVQSPAISLRFENHHVSYWRKECENKDIKTGTITLRKDRRKQKASLAAKTMAINHQVPLATDLS